MYARFTDDDGNEYGSFEVFWNENDLLDDDGSPMPPGFYWWSCFPGCIPDGEPNGPFDTEAEALADAQNS